MCCSAPLNFFLDPPLTTRLRQSPAGISLPSLAWGSRRSPSSADATELVASTSWWRSSSGRPRALRRPLPRQGPAPAPAIARVRSTAPGRSGGTPARNRLSLAARGGGSLGALCAPPSLREEAGGDHVSIFNLIFSVDFYYYRSVG